jgi:hypothetical protein
LAELKQSAHLKYSLPTLVASIVFLAIIWSNSAFFDDELQYWEIAKNVATGEGYKLGGEASAYRPPVWPTLLSPLVFFGVPISIAPVLNLLFLIVTSVAVSELVVRIIRSPWGRLSYALTLLYPVNLFTATTLYPQTFAMMCLSIMAWITTLELEQANWSKSLLFGLLGSAIALSVPTLAYSSALLLVFYSLLVWKARRRIEIIAWFAFLAPIGVWSIRNLIELKSFVLLSTTNGINLLLGNSPNTTPDSGVDVDLSPVLGNLKTEGMTEIERNSTYWNLAVQWISENPFDAFLLYLQKVVHYFSPYDAPVTEGKGSIVVMVIAWSGYLVLVGALIGRIWLSRNGYKFNQLEKFLLVLYLSNAFVMAIFFTRLRFRQPLDFILILEAAIACVFLIAYLRRKKTEKDDHEKVTGV